MPWLSEAYDHLKNLKKAQQKKQEEETWSGGHQCAVPPPPPELLDGHMLQLARRGQVRTGTNAALSAGAFPLWMVAGGALAPRDWPPLMALNRYLHAGVEWWLHNLGRRTLERQEKTGDLTTERRDILVQLRLRSSSSSTSSDSKSLGSGHR